MKIITIEMLVSEGTFAQSAAFKKILGEVKAAILAISNPKGSGHFLLNPTRKGNGVKPIKQEFIHSLESAGWETEVRLSLGSKDRPGPVDAICQTPKGLPFVAEWETGNISSSHRALNKIAIGLLDKTIAGGFLVVPSGLMYPYLTDRIGNFPEIKPYFPIWKNLTIKEGVIGVIEIEHDELSKKAPRMSKGTDGRALR